MPWLLRQKSVTKLMPRSGPMVHMTPRLSGAFSSLRKLFAVVLAASVSFQICSSRGLDQPAKVGEMGEVALAPEQEPAEFLLQLLDRAGERRLGDVTLLGRAGEVHVSQTARK